MYQSYQTRATFILQFVFCKRFIHESCHGGEHAVPMKHEIPSQNLASRSREKPFNNEKSHPSHSSTCLINTTLHPGVCLLTPSKNCYRDIPVPIKIGLNSSDFSAHLKGVQLPDTIKWVT